MTMDARAGTDIIGPPAGDPRRFDHHRPHLARRLDQADSPAGRTCSSTRSRGHFNSYGARRGNHEVMMRGTFANIRIRNKMVPGVEGGFTRYAPTGEVMPIYDAAMRYKATAAAGRHRRQGIWHRLSRDWAAKGTNLLGVRAVIAESFERIHRSNLVGMGVLPLQFKEGDRRRKPRPHRRGEIHHHRHRRAPAAAGGRGRRCTRDDGEEFSLHRPLPDRYRQRARIFPATAASFTTC
jgi:aconitate hydratase